MNQLPLRLHPGADLRQELERICKDGRDSAFVIAGIGSLSNPTLRYAAEANETTLQGSYEILTLVGSITSTGAHLHISVSDKDGNVKGGHVCYGCLVRTTAELLLAKVTGSELAREHDPDTGFSELVVRSHVKGSTNAA